MVKRWNLKFNNSKEEGEKKKSRENSMKLNWGKKRKHGEAKKPSHSTEANR